MAIYEDQQIHTETGSRPIKLQGSRSSPAFIPIECHLIQHNMDHLFQLLQKTIHFQLSTDFSGIGHYQIRLNFYSVLFSDTLTTDKRFVHVRIMY